MPIGAALGAAAIGAGGAAIAGSKNSKAIGKASDATTAGNQQALAAQERARADNVRIQTPLLNTGNAAMGQINALLGLGGQQGTQQYGAPEAPMSEQWANGALQAMGLGSRGDSPATLQAHLAGQVEGPINAQMRSAYEGYQRAHPNQGAGAPAGTVNSQMSANAAYDQFKNYTGYQTRLDEGNNSLNAGYAAGGTLQSGDAMKGFARFNQDYAANEFGQYMNLLGGQQQLGAGAANALSGVNTNYANAASNLAIQNGQNLAQTAVARANNTNGMIQGIGGAFTGALGSFGGSSYGMGG